MKSTKFRIITLILVLSLLAVGATTIVGAQEGTDLPQASAFVKFAHYAPYDSVLENTEVTLSIDGVDQITFIYGEIFPARPPEPQQAAPYYETTDGDHVITITPTGSTDPLLSETISFDANSFNTIVIIGDGTLQPMEYWQLIDVDPNNISPDYSLVRLANVAPTSATIEDTHVDICTTDGVIWMGLSNIAYKEFTDPYLQVPIGEANLTVSVPGTNCGTDLYEFPGIWFTTNQIADMYVVGDNVNQPIDHNTVTGLLYTEPGGGEDEGFLRIGHFSQFAETEEGSSVTVRIDDVDELTDFVFKDTTDYMNLAEGEHEIEVLLSGTDTVIATSTITVEVNVYYTSGIIGDSTDQPVEIYTLEDETDTPEIDAILRIVHAAPIADTIPGTEIDICQSGSIFEGLSSVLYKEYTDPYLAVLAGVFNLYVAEPDGTCENIIFGIEAFGLSDGSIGDLWVLDHDSYCWDCDPIGPPMVNLAHVAPYENNLNLDPINVYVDGALVAENFDFLQFSGYSETKAGVHKVVMQRYSNDEILATGTILLEGDLYYTLHLIGDGDNQPLEVWLLEDEIEPLADAAKIRIVNAAPISPVLAETELDICNVDNTLVQDLEAIPYKGYTDPYDKFDAGYYRLKGSMTGTDCVETVAGLFPYIMDVGDVATIYIFGANVIPTGQIPWPDISANMLYLNIVLESATPIP